MDTSQALEKPIGPAPLSDILTLRFKQGLTYQQIADKYNVSAQAISDRIKRFKSIPQDPEYISAYKSSRADVFAALQIRILDSIEEDDLKKAPLQSKMWSVGVLYDKERLETGQSTQNIGVNEVRSLSRDDLKALAEVVLVERQGRLFESVGPIKAIDQEPTDDPSQTGE